MQNGSKDFKIMLDSAQFVTLDMSEKIQHRRVVNCIRAFLYQGKTWNFPLIPEKSLQLKIIYELLKTHNAYLILLATDK